MKKILILNGSFCEQPVIIKAKEMGYYVITTGNMPNLSGHKFSDEYIEADYSDKDRILEIVEENEVEGIISCANDFGVLTAAYVAEKKGWKGHDTYETASIIHHKDLFKNYCKEHDIPSPLSVAFRSRGEAEEYVQKCEYPIIVKATDLTGGKGISKAENVKEAIAAIKNAFDMSREKHIVIEPFISGEQFSFWAFISKGKIIGTSSNKCFSIHNPYLIQTETYPGDKEEEFRPKLEMIVTKMISDLNLSDGIICIQFIYKDEKVYVIEAMRRCFGNDALSIAERVTGFPWREGYIKSSLGLDCSDLKKEKGKSVCSGHFGIMPYKNGTLVSCDIEDPIETHLYKRLDMIRPGEKINNYMNERISYLFFDYSDIQEANNEVVRYDDFININISD